MNTITPYGSKNMAVKKSWQQYLYKFKDNKAVEYIMK